MPDRTNRHVQWFFPGGIEISPFDNLTKDTGKFWYWQNNYQISQNTLSNIMAMHLRYVREIQQATLDELESWQPVCDRVDITKFAYLKLSIEVDGNFRYPFIRYNDYQHIGNGRSIFSIRHAPALEKKCIHIFDEQPTDQKLANLGQLIPIETADQLLDFMESSDYWIDRLNDRVRFWNLTWDPDHALYLTNLNFTDCLDGDWFLSPAGHDQEVWEETVSIIRSFDNPNFSNLLDIIDLLIERCYPLITQWRPETYS